MIFYDFYVLARDSFAKDIGSMAKYRSTHDISLEFAAIAYWAVFDRGIE